MKYKISKYAKIQGVHYRTVWNWVKAGKVRYETDATGHIWITDEIKEREKTYAVYARVSSSENKANLDSQAERLISYCNAKGYKVAKVVKEVGSGLNDERKKLESLLLNSDIDVIVVEHKDRLARFGLNYIQKLLQLNNRSIEVVNNVEGEKEDLMQDFVSIITSFCARLYGIRRSKRLTERIIKDAASRKDDCKGG